MERPTLVVQLRRTHREPEETLRFARSPVRIGRGSRNELVLDHAFISHQHAVLHFDESGVDFVDLGSTNGSFLDGALVAPHQFASVHAGAEVGVGIARLRVRLDLHVRWLWLSSRNVLRMLLLAASAMPGWRCGHVLSLHH